MTLRKLIDEDDVLEVDDGLKECQWYMVKRVEDLVFDEEDFTTTAVTTGTQSDFVQIDNLEVKDLADMPSRQIYQLVVGVDVGMIYTELETGHFRRNPYKIGRPSSSNRYIGHFDQHMSPYDAPTFEFFLFYKEIPSFSCYNPWASNILPTLAFRGRKLLVYDLENPATDKYFDLGGQRETILRETKANKRPHRHITRRGIDK